MDQQNVAEFVSKRVERFNAFERLCKVMAEDLKEMKYQVTQYEAKVKTYESQILLRKSDIAELDETIRRRKIEAVGSLNSISGDLNRREIELVKSLAELKVREDNVKLRAATAESLITKAEKAIGRQAPEPAAVAVREANAPVSDTELSAPAPAPTPAPVVTKRSPGRPKKGVTVNA